MIKVSAIIMTVLGAAGAIMTLSVLAGDLRYFSGAWVNLMYYELFVAALSLAFGITGIVFAARQDRANIIIAFGIIIICLKIIDIGWGVAELSAFIDESTYVGVLLGCVPAILYIIGGAKRKNAPQ